MPENNELRNEPKLAGYATAAFDGGTSNVNPRTPGNGPGPISQGPSGETPSGAHAASPFALDKTGLLGHVVWLMTQSPPHRHMFITDLEWLVVPALMRDQFRIWHETNDQGARIPSAFASWALLDDEAEERLKGGIKKLRTIDWNSGDNAWLIDLIAPFGGSDKAIDQLRDQVFKGRKVKTLRPSADGQGMVVVEL